MTSFRIEPYPFTVEGLELTHQVPNLVNWPVVYVLDNGDARPTGKGSIYFGESMSFASRMKQHLDSPGKQELTTVRVIVDDTFNKSACLDLESHLIRYAAGDGVYEVLNRNDGVVDANYYDRDRYRRVFDDIFEELRAHGVFHRTIPEIINSELFKLSPFKALNYDQAIAVEDILEGLVEDLAHDGTFPFTIVHGDPGTGKTVVAIYLAKLVMDIAQHRDGDEVDRDTMFSDFFLPDIREQFQGMRIGLVVPQQALRSSIKKVFKKTPGLDDSMVVTMFEVAEDPEPYDLLIVDEAHRLSQYAAQAHGSLTKKYKDINKALFGSDDGQSQLDWLRHRTKHAVLMLDTGQSVRPADIPKATFEALVDEAHRAGRKPHRLRTQMRSRGGDSYIDYVQAVLNQTEPSPIQDFTPYEVGLVDDPRTLFDKIRSRDAEHGLSRIVAGYAWKWVSKKAKNQFDIDLGQGVRLQWNTRLTDWVGSKTSLEEAGSIHTIQGYDLNYAGVVIGPDLRYDPDTDRLYIDRANYFDAAGKKNNTMGGQVTTDEMLFQYIVNIYTVLLTRGIHGTYIHVVDPGLRSYFKRFFTTIG